LWVRRDTQAVTITSVTEVIEVIGYQLWRGVLWRCSRHGVRSGREGLRVFEIPQSILYPTCMQSRETYCDVYYYYPRYTTDGGQIWWRYVVHASRELTSGESSGGSKVSTDGCSSMTRRQARPMPNSSLTAPSVAGRWSGRVPGRRPLPYFLRLTSITC